MFNFFTKKSIEPETSKGYEKLLEIKIAEAEHCRATCDELREMLTEAKERLHLAETLYEDAATINARLSTQLEQVKQVANKQAFLASTLANENLALKIQLAAITSKKASV